MKILAAIALFFIPFFGLVQHSVIPTGTTFDIQQLEVKDGHVFVNSSYGYLSKCMGECDDLVSLSCPNLIPNYYQSFLNVIDTNELYITSSRSFPHHGYIYRSSDGGNSWNVILDTADIFFQRLLVFDTSSVSLVSSFYNSLYSTNGGMSWNAGTHGLILLTASFVLNDSVGFIGQPSGMQRTLNGGGTWSGIGGSPYGDINDIFAYSPDSIFTITTSNSGDQFSYNFNWGTGMWTSESIDYRYTPSALCVKSLDEIYVVGATAGPTMTIMKTTDLGQTWSYYNMGEAGILRDMVLLNDSTAIVAGDDGYLARWSLNSPMGSLSVDSDESSWSVNISPNPTEEKFIVSSNAYIRSVSISNSLGERIFFLDSIQSGPLEIDLDVDGGIYLVTIELVSNQIVQRKLVIK